MEFARGEIARHAGALALQSGRGAVVTPDVVQLLPAGAPPAVQEEEPTWELVVWVRISWDDSVTGTGSTDLTPLRVRRVNGVLANSSVWDLNSRMINAPDDDLLRTISIEFYTRQYATAPTGTPVFEDGRTYAGTVQFVLREVDLALVDTGVEYDIVIPPNGSVRNFGASRPDEVLQLRPTQDSITRVRG